METYIEEIDAHCDLEMSDLEDRLCEILDDYCEQLSKEEGMTRDYDPEEDPEECKNGFIWADKASRLIDVETDRLYSIASKYYNESEMDDITIETHWYKEY